MENHPIPQDVTGFQFKLIGNMTVKQFAYLAVGGIFAVIAFHVPNPTNSIFVTAIKYLCVFLFASTGAALAFLPLEGRPLDVMAINFVKAIFRPNQYLYSKHGGHLAFLHFAELLEPATPEERSGSAKGQQRDIAREVKLQALLSSIHAPSNPKTELDAREAQFLNTVFTQGGAVVKPLAATNPYAKPTAPGAQAQPVLQATSQQLASAKQASLHQASSPDEATRAVKTPSAALHNVLSNMPMAQAPTLSTLQPAQQDASDQMSSSEAGAQEQFVEKQIEASKVGAKRPVVAQSTEQVTADMAKMVGLPHLPDSPNLIIGIVKDSRGNTLQNVLVEVKDKDDNPVRAFKTNALGQFASATPLAEGNYTIDFEDPKGQQQFTSVSLLANGTILQPLIITSVDAREELRKSLFG